MSEGAVLGTWWEKTVEYRFVIEAAMAKKCDFAAPLSGAHERSAGDNIFGFADRFILIEFKRDKGQIVTEKSLFKNFEDARRSLCEYEHHVIVYGKVVPSSLATDKQVSDEKIPFELGLGARHYFQRSRIQDGISIDEIEAAIKTPEGDNDDFENAMQTLDKGVCREEFDKYLKLLAKFKKPDERSKRHIAPEEMSYVIGVCSKGKIVSTQLLYEYAPKLFPRLALDKTVLLGGQEPD